MKNLKMPTKVLEQKGNQFLFKQLGVKVEMDNVSQDEYYSWLDRVTLDIGNQVRGAKIAEKKDSRSKPPLNIAIYYDTDDYQVLPTGALLRTSCNIITHAFCAYKHPVTEDGVRDDYRYVFSGNEKTTIQQAPSSLEAVKIVTTLMSRTDIEHPGIILKKNHGIDPKKLYPSVSLDDYRYTFFVWLDGLDALRCSIDRYTVSNLRLPKEQRKEVDISEVEISLFPRISEEVTKDKRVVQLISALSESLCKRFNVKITTDIKYQRSAKALGISYW